MRALLAALLMLVSASSARASPPDLLGVGPRSTSLGGAVGADVEDASATYYNPAGLARGEALRLSVGIFHLAPELEINGQSSNLERLGGLSLGLVAPKRFRGVNFAFGLSVQLPHQRLARTRSAITDRPRWELYDTRPHRIFLATGAAIRPVPWLTLGAGLAFQAPSTLVLDLRGMLDLGEPNMASRLETQFAGSIGATRYPHAGVQVRPLDELELGLTYRGQVRLDGRVVVQADADVTLGMVDLAQLALFLDSETNTLFGPQQLNLGAAWRPLPWLRVGVDLTWVDWSRHPSPVAAEEIVLTLDPELPIVELPDEIGARDPTPLGLHDTFVPRVGLEARAVDTRALELDVRLGYVYENSPYPAQTGNASFLDADEHTLTLGLGLRLTDLEPVVRGHVAIDAYLLYSELRQRTHVRESLVDDVGDLVTDGRTWGAGIQLSVAFDPPEESE
ncbi:MAG: hypothetical protein AAGH15_12375 [Myxococcota bacterium]